MPRMTSRLRDRLPVALTLVRALASTVGLCPTVASAADSSNETRRVLKLEDATTEQAQSEEYRRLAAEARASAMAKLQALLRDVEDGDRKAEMMLRLAYLYFEQGKADHAYEMESFNKKYDDCFATAKNPDDCEAIIEDHSTSYSWYDKAIKLYEAVLKLYPRYARADEATYYLGVTYKEKKLDSPAVESMKKLVKLYPTSQYVPDAYVYIGEYYFDDNQAFPALTAYKKAASYTDHPRYAYAMYKLGWCYFNVDDLQKAIETMKAVVAYSMAQSSAENKTSVKLEDEALRDLVRFFAEAGALDEAYDYFKKLGRSELIRETMKQLAAIFYDQGKFNEAIDTFRRLIAESPNHPENPVYQKSIVDAYKKVGAKDRVIDELRRLREDYGRSSAWAKANASNPDAISDADGKIEVALKTTATDFNKEARDLQKAKHPRMKEAFDLAVSAYQVYLQDYDKDKRSYELHWDFAELLYELKRYEESYDQYLRVVDLDPKGEHSRDAAESAIFASEQKVGTIEAKSVKVDKTVQPIPLTEWEQRLIASCKRYADLYPGDSKIEAVTYKSAFLLYQRFHFSEAAEQFRSVIARWPNSKNAEFSAKLILGALEIREDWPAMRDTSKSFWQTKELGTDAFRQEMYTIYRKASLDVITVNFETTKDESKFADDLMAFYKEFPDYKDADAILNDASVYYAKAGRVADSMAVRTTLVEDERFAGKTQYYYEQVGQLGFNYEQIADFDKASAYYDKLFSLYPAEREKLVKARDAEKDAEKKAELVKKIEAIDGQAGDAQFTTAVFHIAQGDWQGGVERLQAFIKTFPSDARVPDLRLRIANTYETQGQHDKAVAAFSEFYKVQHKDIDVDRQFYARLHHGRNLITLGKTAEATAVYKESADLYRKLAKAGTAAGAWSSNAAEMMFFLIRPEYDAYNKLDLDSTYPTDPGPSAGSTEAIIKKDTKAIKAKLSEKISALTNLEKKYKEILDTGAGDWGMAALVQLGQAYENIAMRMTTSKPPYYLNAEERDFYIMGLQDAAFPQTSKAVAVYAAALEKAYELNLYNENTALATRKLGELRPGEFPGLAEDLPKGGRTADKTRVFDIEPSL